MKILSNLMILFGIAFLSLTSCKKENVQTEQPDQPVGLVSPSTAIEADFIKYILEKLTDSLNYGNSFWKTTDMNSPDNTISSYFIYKYTSNGLGKYEFVLLKSGRQRQKSFNK